MSKAPSAATIGDRRITGLTGASSLRFEDKGPDSRVLVPGSTRPQAASLWPSGARKRIRLDYSTQQQGRQHLQAGEASAAKRVASIGFGLPPPATFSTFSSRIQSSVTPSRSSHAREAS